MNKDDVDLTAPPREKRLTAHIQTDVQLPAGLVSGTATRRISDSPQFPPDILFDAIYASFILSHFGTESVRDRITAKWEDTFYSMTTMQ